MIPSGGHFIPSSTEGEHLLWKKAQKKAKKKATSLTINKANPIFNPIWTTSVWKPEYDSS